MLGWRARGAHLNWAAGVKVRRRYIIQDNHSSDELGTTGTGSGHTRLIHTSITGRPLGGQIQHPARAPVVQLGRRTTLQAVFQINSGLHRLIALTVTVRHSQHDEPASPTAPRQYYTRAPPRPVSKRRLKIVSASSAPRSVMQSCYWYLRASTGRNRRAR